MKTMALYEHGEWKVMSWIENNTWWVIVFYHGRAYKAKKFPTMDSALAWAKDLMWRVDRGIESDPV